MTPAGCRMLVALGAGVALPALALLAQPKPAETKDAPKVLTASPLGLQPGVTTKLTLRGLKLDTAIELEFPDAKATVKILSKGKSAPPNQQDANRVGDTQIEAEVTLPADVKAAEVTYRVKAEKGESPPRTLPVDAAAAVPEKEPNNGFRQAQAVSVPSVVAAAIQSPQDVDVFRFEGPKGRTLILEVQAARYGSALDAVLAVYTGEGRLLASNDDADGGTDARIELTLPADGVYLVTVSDAHDLGGPAHGYRLVLRPK